jgi:uncharacterized iron-regulated membrane protein
MGETTRHTQGPAGRAAASVFRWLLLAAAFIWLLQAVTGILLAYSFEIDDKLMSSVERQKDLAAIERRMDAIEATGGEAKINWIWSTAGMKDRFVLNYTAADGEVRSAHIAGDGTFLRDTNETDYTFLEWVREVHLSLTAGSTGEWILAISGILLLGYLIYGVFKRWPRRERWRDTLNPGRETATGDRLRAWYRAIGFIGVVPTFIVVSAAVVIFFEHSIEGPIGAPPISLPAVPPGSEGVGFAAVARAAEAAIPGSRFVGTSMPSEGDATYPIWVNEPGEYFREQGYGGSLVMIDGNDGSVRGAWPLKKASPAYQFIALPYPVHTGEIIGPVGRFLVMLTGFWLMAMTILGLVLWYRGRKQPAR